jgi:hypothetical protein
MKTKISQTEVSKLRVTVKGLLALILLLAFALLLAPKLQAQPYVTNTGTIYGAQQYNQSYPTPLQPSKMLANQYAAGMLAGIIPPAQVAWPLITNTFATNIFSTAPYVVFSLSATNGFPTNAMPAVISTSPTNFVVWAPVTNCYLYWEATGH